MTNEEKIEHENGTVLNMEENVKFKENNSCMVDISEIHQPEKINVLDSAYKYAREQIIFDEQNKMFNPFLMEFRKAYLLGFKYAKDGGNYNEINTAFNAAYKSLQDVGGGFWNSYKNELYYSYLTGAKLFFNSWNIELDGTDLVEEALSNNCEKLSCMELWAKNEIENICKKDNPDFDIFSDDFDYDWSCYKSAFKAYRSICNDGHSGMSYGFTRNILIKLLNEQPLTPIVDEDFSHDLGGTIQYPLESEEYLKERGLKSDIQCPRRSGLFRTETLDGKVTYTDIDRSYCFDIEHPSNTYHGFGCSIVDELFPITMPYMPSAKKYEVATREFLVDKSHGDFDTIEIAYINTPEGEKVDVNRYFTDGRNVGKNDENFSEITKEQYEQLLKKRIDKIEDKITSDLVWTLISNSHSDKETEILENNYNNPSIKEEITKLESELKRLVIRYIIDANMFEYNTFSMHQAVCNNNEYYDNVISKIDGFSEISDCLHKIYKICSQQNENKRKINN